MTVHNLRDLERCFEGVIPATLCTVDASGLPNIIHLSRVTLVDDGHIALSRQFFGKTAKNLEQNPRASLFVTDQSDYRHYRFDLTFVRSEASGPLFDKLKAYVDAAASLTGMQEVFRLSSADVFAVRAIEHVEGGHRLDLSLDAR